MSALSAGRRRERATETSQLFVFRDEPEERIEEDVDLQRGNLLDLINHLSKYVFLHVISDSAPMDFSVIDLNYITLPQFHQK